MPKPPSFGALVDVLKADLQQPEFTQWQDLEEHVQKVFQSLLELQGERAVVARNAVVKGRDGAAYQIDVYYEFERADVRHRVAIECKNKKRAIERKDVLAFKATMDDCLGIQGIIVAVNGFQEGARDFAARNGVRAITLEELPSLGNILGRRLESVLMPSEDTLGSPFWSIFEEETFSPLQCEGHAVLFFSKGQAEAFMKQQQIPSTWCVRGLKSKNLATLIMTADVFRGKFSVAIPPFLQPHPARGIGFAIIDRADLISTYCQDCGVPSEPMVAPWL